jgi:clan AA aspartic protease (TIGR02281 family)
MVDSAAGARRNITLAPANRTFWEAMSGLDTGFVSRHEVTDTQREFSRAVGAMMSGDYERAAAAFDSLTRRESDSITRGASRVLLTAMLQHQGAWSTLAGLGERRGNDRAGVESWAGAFSKVAPRQIVFPRGSVVLPLIVSAGGTPMIQVSINGRPRSLWLDTGSSLSILASDVAESFGVRALSSDTLEIATATGRVPAMPASIDRLDIGGIQISNATAMIVAEELMRVRLSETDDPRSWVKIDGVVGFDIMSRFDIRIDYVNGIVTIQEPVRMPPPRGGRNLYWVGTPVVRVITQKGIPLHFNLDTGAEETYATDGLPVRTKVRTFSGERRLIGGIAGLRVAHGSFIDELHVSTSGQPIVFRKLLVFVPDLSTFVSLDGVLGSDVGRGGVVRIDATNGIFRLEQAVRRLRPPG